MVYGLCENDVALLMLGCKLVKSTKAHGQHSAVNLGRCCAGHAFFPPP